MKYLTQEEINGIADKFIALRDKAEKSKSKKIRTQYKQYQNYCMDKLKFLVLNKVGKYRKFSNYIDLEQDGYEALILALRTYVPGKGAFSWWADKYISTRVSRAANAHSTIRFPLKKAKEVRPFKMSIIPIVIDSSPDALENLESSQTTQNILEAIKQLPDQHQTIINMTFGFNGVKQHSIGNVTKQLSISRPQFLKLLEEAKTKLKEILNPLV
ncbi:MAG TPA: sigma-70 family RNA polymerase sigma factor [Anaerovoracaceae bacterium]|nr:sigma-70 family RNA polymerase sigma factor [Anaerovoracaceae bacterium]